MMLLLRLKESTCQGPPTTKAREDNLYHQTNATYSALPEPQYGMADSDWWSQKAQGSELDQRLQPTPLSCVLSHPS